MAERAEALATRFEEANAELAAVIEGCTDAQWRATCKGEGWSVGVTAHHVAFDQDHITKWFTAIATGRPLPPPAEGGLDASNARHAAQYASCTKAETLDLLRAGGVVAARAVRALSDEQLDRESLPTPGRPAWTAGGVVERILIGHVVNHMASIRAAIGGQSA